MDVEASRLLNHDDHLTATKRDQFLELIEGFGKDVRGDPAAAGFSPTRLDGAMAVVGMAALRARGSHL